MEVAVASLMSSRRKGVSITFKSGSMVHIAAKDDKESLKFEVLNSAGFSSNLSGLIGKSIRPRDYTIQDGVITIDGKTIEGGKRTWIDHSYCYLLVGSDVNTFLGLSLEDFAVQNVVLLSDSSDPK